MARSLARSLGWLTQPGPLLGKSVPRTLEMKLSLGRSLARALGPHVAGAALLGGGVFSETIKSGTFVWFARSVALRLDHSTRGRLSRGEESFLKTSGMEPSLARSFARSLRPDLARAALWGWGSLF